MHVLILYSFSFLLFFAEAIKEFFIDEAEALKQYQIDLIDSNVSQQEADQNTLIAIADATLVQKTAQIEADKSWTDEIAVTTKGFIGAHASDSATVEGNLAGFDETYATGY